MTSVIAEQDKGGEIAVESNVTMQLTPHIKYRKLTSPRLASLTSFDPIACHRCDEEEIRDQFVEQELAFRSSISPPMETQMAIGIDDGKDDHLKYRCASESDQTHLQGLQHHRGVSTLSKCMDLAAAITS